MHPNLETYKKITSKKKHNTKNIGGAKNAKKRKDSSASLPAMHLTFFRYLWVNLEQKNWEFFVSKLLTSFLLLKGKCKCFH